MKKLRKNNIRFEKDIRSDLKRIKSILVKYGAERIILYGSLARGTHHKNSDIDICVDGISDKNYFRVVAECIMKSFRPVSIIPFRDIHGFFRHKISEEGLILYEQK